MAVTPDGDYLYVPNGETDSVTVISTRENAILGAPIPVGDGPNDVSIRRDGKRAYVINGGADTVSVIDTATNRTTGTPIPLVADASDTVVSTDGRHIYTTNAMAKQGPYRLTVVDTASGRAADPVPLDTVTSKLAGTRIPLSPMVAAMAVSPDGSRLYVSALFDRTVAIVDTRTNAKVGSPIGIGLVGKLVVSPDGERVYAATYPGSVVVIKTGAPFDVAKFDLGS